MQYTENVRKESNRLYHFTERKDYMNIRKSAMLLSALCAISVVASACSSTGTGSDNSTTPETTLPPSTLKEEYNSTLESIDMGEDVEKLENGKVVWLSTWDINPKNGKAMPAELELFKNNYGGEISFIQCTFEERFEKLSTMVLSGDSPDLFPAADLDVFPKCAMLNLFAPMDEYIDFSEDIWQDISHLNDVYTLNGKHYVCNMSADAGTVMIYNKNTIESNNLDDPAELLDKGKWDWDSFKKMMADFCSPDENQYAIDGWWFEQAFVLTTGVPFIGYENGKLTNNLDDPLINHAEEFMQMMNNEKFPYPKAEHEWQIAPANIAAGKTLFYPVGVWQLYEADLSMFGEMEDIMFVPMPKCTYVDKHYLPAGVDAMAMVQGSKNPEGAAAFLKCRRIASTDPQTLEIQRNQFYEDYKWTEEMMDMYIKVKEMTNENPVFDFYGAVSSNLYSYVHNPMKEAFNAGVSWTQTKESIKGGVQSEIDKANKTLAELNPSKPVVSVPVNNRVITEMGEDGVLYEGDPIEIGTFWNGDEAIKVTSNVIAELDPTKKYAIDLDVVGGTAEYHVVMFRVNMANWPAIKSDGSLTDDGGCAINTGATTFTVVLDAEDIQKATDQGGLIIWGHDYTVSKIRLYECSADTTTTPAYVAEDAAN